MNAAAGAAVTSANDDRITKAGRLLRRYHIDELPQIFNVLKGEMSFIGPRPERPEFVKQLADEIPYYNSRHAVKPGITGWAQINQHYDTCVEDVRRKLAFDLEYVEGRSALEDLRIMAMTVPVVLFRKGGW